MKKIYVIDALYKKNPFSMIAFTVTLILILCIALLYLYNIFEWGDYPDFGFGLRDATGIKVVGVVTENGRKAGIQVGDHIIRINGKTYTTVREARSALNWELGKKNTYLIERKGQQFQVTITNIPKGLRGSFNASGLPYLVGLCYVLIGTIVFIMKPHYRTTWIFFLFSSMLGIFLMFTYKIGMMKPFELGNLDFFTYTFTPAVFIHLALCFPEERSLIKKYPYIQFAPYFISTLLFLCVRHLTPTLFAMDIPKTCFIIIMAYLVGAIVVFLGSSLQLWLRPPSQIIRLRSKVILLGAAASALVPLLETLLNTIFQIYILPSFNYFLPFLIIFPSSIGYSIVRHNLFDVDLYIKRAVGYGLMTALVGATYFFIQMIMRPAFLYPLFGEFSEKIYPIFFAILVVFLFNPINRRVQKGVDKLFYRKKFDYKETVINVSNALTSVLNLTEVIKRIINTVRREMFIDTAGIILLEPQKKDCQTLFIGDSPDKGKDQVKDVCIPYDDPLLSLLSKEKKLITVYDIAEDPHYRSVKEPCSQRFSEMGAIMVMPFIYQDEVKGVLSLGNKKSGHFYTREDIDLLETLANHGAIAIENARLVDQMEKELIVRTNLSRYISPQVVEQIIKKDRQVNLGGNRKNVTVLISDIRHFTRITEIYSPDKLVQILNEYFTDMAKIIFENQGSLDKYIGDAIVAVFGSLIPLENAAQSAIRAAVQMMKRMNALNESWMQNYRLVMNIGIGINTGEVFLGNVGSPERMEFTVIGDTVNVASRFSDIAKEGQILISRNTLASLSSDIKYKELPPTVVKGKTGKLEVFEIVYS
jgi:adenylate cyclase